MVDVGISARPQARYRISSVRAWVAGTRRVLGSHGVMVLACVVVLLPFVWVLLSSFKTIPDFYHWPPSFWPKHFTLAHYAYAFGHFPLLWGYYANSWVITPTTVAVVTVISTMAGYAFARLPFRLSKGIFVVMVATLFFPVQIISVFVMYQLTSAMGLIDTRLGLILAYTSLLLPVYIFIMRTVFVALPGEIEEAAKVDGASNWQVFRKVMLPLAKPGIAVVVILSFVNVWGEYLWADTLTVSKAIPIAVGITQIQTNMGGTDLPVMTAAYVIAIVPPVLLFIALQRWFMGGLQGLSVGKDDA